MIRRTFVFIATIFLAAALGGCTSAHNNTTNDTPQTADIVDMRPSVEKTLQSAGFARISEEGTLPSKWKKADDVVSLNTELAGETYLLVAFPEGALRCDNIGASAAGFDPVEQLKHLHEAGYQKSLEGTLIVGSEVIFTHCKAVA